MRQVAFLLIIGIFFQQGYSQTVFLLNDYPLSGKFTILHPDSAKQLFEEVKHTQILDYRYTRGGCDYRAHAVSLLLKNKGVSTFKIWNFAAAKIFLAGKDFNKHNLLLKVKDNINLSTQLPYYRECGINIDDSVFWGYHVAPVVLVANGKKIDTLAFDPALFDRPVEYRAWVSSQLQSGGSSYITFLNSNFISFQTESQLQKNGVNCNDCSGNDIITGVFWDDSYSISKKWIEESISRGRIFMEYYMAEIMPLEKELAKYEVSSNLPNVRALACKLAEKKNIISTESGMGKLPKNYHDKYKKYVEEATKTLFK